MRYLYLFLLLVTTQSLATRQETVSADCLKIQDGTCITKVELGNVSGSTSNLQTQITTNTTAIAGKQDTITGAATTITTSNLSTNKVMTTDGSGKAAASATVDTTELGYVDGATSNIQTQLDAKEVLVNKATNLVSPDNTKYPTTQAVSTGLGLKQDTITGAATTITTSNLSTNKVMTTDGSGKAAASATVDTTELGYVDGATSNIQTQLNTLQGYDKVLEFTNLAGFPGTGATATLYLDKALNKLYRWNGSAYTLVGDGTGTGDVVGPAGATDLAIAIYDGTTGKLIKNSVTSVNSSGDITANSINASSSSSTSSFSGLQINNSQITATGATNLDLNTASTSNSINLKGYTTFNKLKNNSVTDDSTSTGSNVSLTLPTTPYYRFTNASLVSIDMIGAPTGTGARELALMNNTGVDITLNDQTGATAANQIFTGTGTNLVVKNKAQVLLVYNATSTKWTVSSGAGGVSLKAQNGTSALAAEIQVPNNQVTITSTGKYLVETGNNNILANASFEAPFVSSLPPSWSLTAGTASQITSEIHGSYAVRITLSSQILEFYQNSTLYATGFTNGVNGITYIRAKTSMANIYVCRGSAGSIVASTDGTNITNCVLISNSNTWGEYEIPTILGATSNGIYFKSLTPSTAAGLAVTGTIDLEEAKVEAGTKAKSVDQSRIAGESYFPGTTSCTWPRTSATLGAFTVTSACPGPTINYSTMGTWATTDSDLPRQTITNLPAGTYEAIFYVPTYSTASNENSMAINDGTTTCTAVVVNSSTATGQGVVSCVFSYTGAGTRTFELYGASSSSTVNIYNATATTKNLKFVLKYFGSGQLYTTQDAIFSTDTTPLTFKASAIVSTDPVGTYNTYSYAINSNTKTICTTAPTTLPTSTDGFLIFSRFYSSASTCGNPSRVEIKIGTGMQKIAKEIYKSAAKVTSGSLTFDVSSTTESFGAWSAGTYDASTGVLIFDSGRQITTNTTASFLFSDITTQASGYLVINASKDTSKVYGSFADFNYVAARGVNTSATSVANSGTTALVFDSVKTYDTHNALDTTTGIFTCPKAGLYDVSWQVLFNSTGAYTAGNTVYSLLQKNGSTYVYGSIMITWAALAVQVPTAGSTKVSLAVGDTLKIVLFNNRTAGATLLDPGAGGTYFSVTRVPGQ